MKVFSPCFSSCFLKDKEGTNQTRADGHGLSTGMLQGLMGADLCVCLPISLHCLQSQPTISMHSATDEAQNGAAIWHAYISEFFFFFFNSAMGGRFRSGVFTHAASLAFRREGFNSSIKSFIFFLVC